MGILDLLQKTPLAACVDVDQDVVVLEHNQSIADALKVLARHNILSAPIVVSPGLEDVEGMEEAPASPSLMGWLDVRDIIKSFLAFLHEGPQALPTNMLALMTELEKQGPVFAAKRLITVLGSEDRGLVYQTDAEASMLAAIRDMFLGQQDGGRLVHRLAIFDAHGDITHIVSQVDVLRFLLQHSDELGAAAGQSITELGLASSEGRRLVVLEPTTPTLLAYEKLAAAGVTGAPVLSGQGEVIANLSISDIRGIQPDHFGVLALPVAEFLAVKHGTSYLGYSQHDATWAAAKEHPYFASSASPHPAAAAAAAAAAAGGMRPTGPDAADADAAAAAAESREQQQGAAAGRGLERSRSGAAGGAAGGDGGVPLITCSPQATLLEVLRIMCGEAAVHRVYVREKGRAPHEVLAVITPTDILALLAKSAGLMAGAAGGAGKRAGGEAAAAAGAVAAEPASAVVQQQEQLSVDESAAAKRAKSSSG